MNKRLFLIALVSSAIISWSGTLKAGAQVLIPRTALAVPVKAQPIVIADSEKDEHAEVRDRRMWRVRLTSDYGPVQTNTVGAQGTGAALSFALTAQFPDRRFANTLSFTRYNTEFPVLRYCPTCGAFVGEYENDDYDEWDDDFDWFFGSRNCRIALGISYAYYHPVYEAGGYNMGGVGFGIDKFPSDRMYYSLYTHDYYYPNISGSYNNQMSGGFQILRYDVGLSVHPDKRSGLSYQLGLKGENWIGKGQNSRYNEINPYLGMAWSKF